VRAGDAPAWSPWPAAPAVLIAVETPTSTIVHGRLCAITDVTEAGEIVMETPRFPAKILRRSGYAATAIRHDCCGKRLAGLAGVVIDNCVPPEDSLVRVGGWPQPVAAGSTLTVIAISMGLVAELAGQLAARGIKLPVFVSPNVASVPPEHNEQVFAQYARTVQRAL
jgi:hypothetical protein